MDALGPNVHVTAFGFSFERVMICPDLDVVIKAFVFWCEVVKQDLFFTGVTVPPFVGCFNVDAIGFVFVSDRSALAYARFTVSPRVIKLRDFIMVRCVEMIQLH